VSDSSSDIVLTARLPFGGLVVETTGLSLPLARELFQPVPVQARYVAPDTSQFELARIAVPENSIILVEYRILARAALVSSNYSFRVAAYAGARRGTGTASASGAIFGSTFGSGIPAVSAGVDGEDWRLLVTPNNIGQIIEGYFVVSVSGAS
jgi:predicted benzoate:H+ symporter BenE